MSFRTMAQPSNETFTMKVKLSEKQEKQVNLAVLVFMSMMTLFGILVTYL